MVTNVKVWLVRKHKRLKNGEVSTYWTLRWQVPGSTAGGRPKLASESLGTIGKTAAQRKRQDKIAALSSNRPGITR